MGLKVRYSSPLLHSAIRSLDASVKHENDPLITLVEDGAEAAIASSNPASPVNIFPWCKRAFTSHMRNGIGSEPYVLQ